MSWRKCNQKEVTGIRTRIKMFIEYFMRQDEKYDDLVPEISGPWMRRWEIVHHNKHTASLVENECNWHKA